MYETNSNSVMYINVKTVNRGNVVQPSPTSQKSEERRFKVLNSRDLNRSNSMNAIMIYN
jgi:hypothetical protein